MVQNHNNVDRVRAKHEEFTASVKSNTKIGLIVLKTSSLRIPGMLELTSLLVVKRGS